MTSTSANTPRRTRQRTAVGSIMATLDEFRTAQEVHAILRGQDQSVGLATVYRNLQQMAETGAVDCIRTPDGQAAYRACSTGHHHHLTCRDCGKTVEITPPDFEDWIRQVASAHSFTEIHHELELFGRCSECARAAH
jgi:Fur family transcriptional regulator, ferric uptake regulator